MKTFFWVLGLIASQFYIFKSGTPQPSHIYIACLMLFGLIGYGAKYRKNLIELYFNNNYYITLFIFYCISLNFVYSIIYQETSFLYVNLFWVFGFLLYGSFYSLLTTWRNDYVLKCGCVIGLLLIVVFYFAGLGRYNFGMRFNSYFNDPNQMAFWALCVASCYYLLKGKRSFLLDIVTFLLVLLIVFASMSRGALLGFIILCFGYVYSQFSKGVSLSKLLLLSFSILIAFLSLYVLFEIGLADTSVKRLESTDYHKQADLRGYYRVFDYPEYLIFGAGQGIEQRFNTSTEIHSSWMGILFYYGSVGLLLFILFILKIFKNLKVDEIIFIMSPFIFALTVYGLRAPIIWMLLAVSTYISYARAESKNIKRPVKYR